VRRRIWFAGYVTLILLPLAAAWLTDPLAAPRDIGADVGVAFGLLALTLLLVQFALVSRLRPVSRPFGGDVLMQWHRGMALVALAFVVLHALFVPGVSWDAWILISGSIGTRMGALALWLLAAIVVTSIARQPLRLSYEAWQAIHLVTACAITAAALWHVFAIGVYAGAPGLRWVLAAYAGLFAALLVRYRVHRPIRLARHPWLVVANEDVGGSVRCLRVRPDGHDGFRFQPGQFAWLLTGRSPFVSAQHPLSIASSADPHDGGELEFAIKALGDWSAMTVPAIAPGRRVWVDGPYGGFTPNLTWHQPLVLIAGGIGIAPMRSILRTMRDRGAGRRVYLFFAAWNWSRVVFADELEQLTREIDVRVTYVFEQPELAWEGERGFITAETLERHLPAGLSEFDYFVCGPVPMIDALERVLTRLRVPPDRIHTERFQMV
jgi:predicted ferric reductase